MAKASKEKGKVKATKKSGKSGSEHAPVLYKTTVSGIIETDEDTKKKKKTGKNKETTKTSKKTNKKRTPKKITRKTDKKKTGKKHAKKKTTKNKSKPSKSHEKREIERMEKKISHEKEKETDKALTDNFIALQKVMVNLSSKFDGLSTQISKLLELFEISAKSLAQKDFEKNKENKDSKEILEKLDNISQQAGLIGKGLVLIHEASGGRGFSTESGTGPQSHEEKMKGMQASRGMKPVPSRIHSQPTAPEKKQVKTQNRDQEEQEESSNEDEMSPESTEQQQGSPGQTNQEQPTPNPLKMNPQQNQQTNPNPNMQQEQEPEQNQNTEPDNNQENPQSN
ncbi:MAG: hypothetical protein WDZ69_01940 [Candidatus Pacearchaeota archaeon]